MCTQKFFRCKHCGNFVGLINNAGVPMICCGKEMDELVPNTVEASNEKHIPKIEVKERLVYVEVGSVIHPAEEAHHIEFIYLQTKNGGQRKCIKVGEKPAAIFAVIDDKPLEVFAYCNLHGLWKAEVMCDCGCEKSLNDCTCDDTCDHGHGTAQAEITFSSDYSEGCK